MTVPAKTSRTRHHEAPDTSEAFRRLRSAPEGQERERLIEELATAWLPMAHRIARGYRQRGEALEDLQQVAALGLIKAIKRYDPALAPAFETFAVPTITGELRRHFRDYTWSVHVPRRVQEARTKVRAARQELAQQPGGRAPTIATVAAHCGLSEQEVREGDSARDSYSPLSLDKPVLDTGGHSRALSDLLGDTDPAYDLVIDREAIKPALHMLPPREQHILYLRFFEDMTQSRIAEKLGISQMHVSRLLSRTCAWLRSRSQIQPTAQAGPTN